MKKRIRKPLTEAQRALHREAQRRYSGTEKGRVVQRGSTNRYRSKDEVKVRLRAREAVREAVKSDRLERSPCYCGEVVVQGHHARGYDRAHWLDVEWLCRLHHRMAHH